jgi:cyclophilin family peptidyl-prolyl cis-trans isomerase
MRRRNVLAATIPVTGLTPLLTACGGSAPSNAAGGTPVAAGAKTATLELEKGGNIVIELFPQAAPQGAPKTVENFIQKSMANFYAGLLFHRVEDWVIQGGDPRCTQMSAGCGTGGGQMATELNERPFVVGSVGVARGQDIRVSNDSQFFICVKPAGWLDRQYTNFGQVISGMEIVQSVKVGDKIKKISIKG